MPLATEHVEIEAQGQLDMSGWILSDKAGVKFTFPAGFMARGAVRIWTRVGKNTQNDLYLGRQRVIWQRNDRAILKDTTGKIVSEKVVE